jgi:hypothetical protein
MEKTIKGKYVILHIYSDEPRWTPGNRYMRDPHQQTVEKLKIVKKAIKKHYIRSVNVATRAMGCFFACGYCVANHIPLGNSGCDGCALYEPCQVQEYFEQVDSLTEAVNMIDWGLGVLAGVPKDQRPEFNESLTHYDIWRHTHGRQ